MLCFPYLITDVSPETRQNKKKKEWDEKYNVVIEERTTKHES
jgi:hypothetical protein